MTVEELHALVPDQHFECIVTDGVGNVMFGVPIPGHPELEWVRLEDEHGSIELLSGRPDYVAWELAWADYLSKLQTPPVEKQNRTRKHAEAAGAIVSMPDRLALPTLIPYQHAMTTIDDPAAHLQPITKYLADRLRFENGKLYFEGLDASTVDLVQYYNKTPQAISELDLPTLRALYSVILKDLGEMMTDADTIMEKVKDPQYLGHSVKLYLADFMRMTGYEANTSKEAQAFAIAKISSFQRVIGVTEEHARGRVYHSMYPVMVWMGYDDKDGTLSFASPYINWLIMTIAQNAIQRDKQDRPKLTSSGKPFMLPNHTYLVKSSIAKERNKRAVEIVCIVTTLIEQAGDNVPHISARTIVDRCPDLKNALDAATTANKTLILKRAFSKAWELLHTHTDLEAVYKNIRFPSAIPTSSTLDMVFEFPHDGKRKKGEK